MLTNLIYYLPNISPKGVEDHKYSTYYSQSTFYFLNLPMCVKIFNILKEKKKKTICFLDIQSLALHRLKYFDI